MGQDPDTISETKICNLKPQARRQASPSLPWSPPPPTPRQARNQDFMRGGANEAKVDQTTEMYFLFSDPFI